MWIQSSQKHQGYLEETTGTLGSKPTAVPASQRCWRLCQEKVSSTAVKFLKMGWRGDDQCPVGLVRCYISTQDFLSNLWKTCSEDLVHSITDLTTQDSTYHYPEVLKLDLGDIKGLIKVHMNPGSCKDEVTWVVWCHWADLPDTGKRGKPSACPDWFTSILWSYRLCDRVPWLEACTVGCSKMWSTVSKKKVLNFWRESLDQVMISPAEKDFSEVAEANDGETCLSDDL